MKKIIWVMLLTATVMLNSSCEEGAASASSSTVSYLESEGNTTNITKTALDMHQYAGDMKPGVSTSHFKKKVTPKCSMRRGNELGALVVLLVDYVQHKYKEDNKKKSPKH